MIHIILLSIIFVVYCCIGIGLGFILKDMFYVDSATIKLIAMFLWPAIVVIGFVFGVLKLIRYVLEK